MREEIRFFGGSAQPPLSVDEEPCAWRLFHPRTGEKRFFDASDLTGIDEPLRVYRDDGWQITPLYAPVGTTHPPSKELAALVAGMRRLASCGVSTSILARR